MRVENLDMPKPITDLVFHESRDKFKEKKSDGYTHRCAAKAPVKTPRTTEKRTAKDEAVFESRAGRRPHEKNNFQQLIQSQRQYID